MPRGELLVLLLVLCGDCCLERCSGGGDGKGCRVAVACGGGNEGWEVVVLLCTAGWMCSVGLCRGVQPTSAACSSFFGAPYAGSGHAMPG